MFAIEFMGPRFIRVAVERDKQNLLFNAPIDHTCWCLQVVRWNN